MNVYLISNESYHLINDEIKKIIKDNNFITFNMNKCSIKELINEANYFSLDCEKKYIVATNADFFGSLKIPDEDNELLQNYMANPNPNTIIIFTTLNGIDLRKKITKDIKNNDRLISASKLDRKSVSSVLNSYLKKYGYSADYESINYVIDNSYNNVDIMINELDKVMLFYKNPTKISLIEIKNVIGESKDNNNFHFISAVVEKKLSLALKIYNDLKIYKVEPLSLVILLAREYRLMYFVKKMHEKESINNICSKLGLMDWQVNKLYTNSLNYKEKELLEYLVLLCNIDLNIKKGIWDKDTAIYNFLMEACS